MLEFIFFALGCFVLTVILKDVNDMIDKEWVNTLIGIIVYLFMMFGIAFLYIAAGFGLGYL